MELGSGGPAAGSSRHRFVSESPPDKAVLPAQAPEPPQLRERQEYRHSRAVRSLSGISKAFCSAQISPLASLSPQAGTGSPTFISSASAIPAWRWEVCPLLCRPCRAQEAAQRILHGFNPEHLHSRLTKVTAHPQLATSRSCES